MQVVVCLPASMPPTHEHCLSRRLSNSIQLLLITEVSKLVTSTCSPRFINTLGNSETVIARDDCSIPVIRETCLLHIFVWCPGHVGVQRNGGTIAAARNLQSNHKLM